MKRSHSIAGKGILHEDWILEVLGKKEEDPSEFYDLKELLLPFVNKSITLSIKEDQPVEQAEE